jgi:hypothetical protein
LRGSAGVAPASLSSPHGEDAQTDEEFERTENTCEMNLLAGEGGSQTVVG